MSTLKKLASKLIAPRFWVIFILVVSVIVQIFNDFFWDSLVLFMICLFVLLLIVVIQIVAVSLGSYEVDAVVDYVHDIQNDVFFLLFSILAVVCGILLRVFAIVDVSVLALSTLSLAPILATSDFLISLRLGASKLLEADKTQIQALS